jgi:non-specific protein-tyrosine kinase
MDLTAFLHVLRRRLFALLLCVAAGVGGALALTSTTPKLYEATSRVVVNIPPTTSVQQGTQGLQLTSDLLPTYAQIVTSRKVAAKVKDALSLPEGPEAVRRKLSAAPEPNTLLIDIGATDRDPVRARSIADAASVALSEAVADLERERTVGAAITVTQLDEALLPRTPIEPRPVYNLVLGLVLGLTAGVLLALALDALDRSIKTAVQMEAAAEVPVLALLPRFRRGQSGVVAAHDSQDPASEAYRTLRTSVLYLRPDEPLQVVVVTSAGQGEGKTTTVLNLAATLAQGGERVVVVDADLRRAAVASGLGLEGAVGLCTVVTRRAELADALQEWHGLFWVLPSGQLPPNPSEIVGSQRMAALLEELRGAFDVVLLDTPPVLPVTDAVALSTQADGVLLVGRAGRTQRQHLAEARRRLEGVKAPVVGAVLNAVSSNQAQGYYASYRPISGQVR